MAKSSAASGETKTPVIIALVFFVLTTLILGVLAYTFSDAKNLALADAKKAGDEKAAAESVTKKTKAELNMYKVMVGTASPEERADLQAANKGDLQASFATMQSQVVNQARAAIQSGPTLTGQQQLRPEDLMSWEFDKTDAPKKSLLQSAVEMYAARVVTENKVRNETKGLEDAKAAMNKLANEFDKLLVEYKKRNDEIPNVIAKQIEGVKQEMEAYKKKYEEDKQDSRTAIQKANDDRDQAAKDNKRTGEMMTSVKNNYDRLLETTSAIVDPLQFDRPQGKIIRRYSDALVDIDLGYSDKVRPGLTFAVFPSDTPSRGMQARNRPTGQKDSSGAAIARPVPKGKLEVVEVLGPNLSQCRITEEESQVRDRILSGDLLYNAIWRKGAADHVVLYGIFDLDGDGKDDIQQLVRDLTRVGVVVDGYYDFAKQKWEGDFSAQTTFAVEGWSPSVGGVEGNKEAKIKIINLIADARKQARERGVRTLQPRDFFPRIGYNARMDVSQDAVNQAATAYTRAILAAPADPNAAPPPTAPPTGEQPKN